LKPIRKILVANRGEIARRIFRACDELGIATAAVYSEADREAAHVRDAREAVLIGPAPSRKSYLSIPNLIAAAERTSADAIHPGYGFLAENADFAAACEAAGIVFIGPRSETIRAMGSKIEARKIAERAGVPVVPSEGFPLLVKAAAGGGGKGMRRVDRAADLDEAMAGAMREAESAFGDGTLLVERYIEGARHIEVQIVGDGYGNVTHMFERECSIQRRHQKIIEESPAAKLAPELRAEILDAAARIGREIGYSSLGTVEFLVAPSGEFYFLEVNTRIQVEHPVTEMVLGLDLVRMQIEIAEGRALEAEDLTPRGHAIEARLYAEDAEKGFVPSTGNILAWRAPQGVRVESGIEVGSEIGIHYDPLLAKIVAHAPTRLEAIRKLRHALENLLVHGVITNREFLVRVLDHPDFIDGCVSTDFAIPFAHDRSGEAECKAALEAYLSAQRQASRKILPNVSDGYRNNPFGAGQRSEARVVSIGAGNVRAEIGGVQREYVISEDAGHYWVDGHIFPRVPRYPASGSRASRESASSPMPGQVLRILVARGSEVRIGDPLVVLEAMKMEQTIYAHADGIVDQILVATGQVVAPGQTLVRISGKETV
jgi:acetyl/propionyl-CoA carboxylase alpha subunit